MNTQGTLLTGLDGSNPLGFLAAVGTLRTLDGCWSNESVSLHFQRGTFWTPVISAKRHLSIEDVVSALDRQLRTMENHPAFAIDDDLKIPPEKYRCEFAIPATQQALTSRERTWADFVAAFGCDAVSGENSIEDTAFRTMSGAGHQHFLKTMRDLVSDTSPDQLRQALFENWSYQDGKPSLRWDPMDDRRYALRWNEPSGDPIRTVRGANRLAIEALPMFPTMPTKHGLETTGFKGFRSRDTFWTWPIWRVPLRLDLVRSVLSLFEIQESKIDRRLLSEMGIEEVFRSQRLTIGKFRNFTPAASAT